MRGKRLALALWACGALLSASAAEEVQTLTGFRVPEYDKDGKLTSQLFGDLAQFMPDGVIKISNMKIEFFKDGEIDMTVTSPECVYFERDKRAESDSSVRIARGNMVVTGVGFIWRSSKERLEIFNEAKVVLKDARESIEPGAGEEP